MNKKRVSFIVEDNIERIAAVGEPTGLNNVRIQAYIKRLSRLYLVKVSKIKIADCGGNQ